MGEPFVFDPRCPVCKSPFGAVPCGTAVAFHCRPLASEGFTHCALVVHREFLGEVREIPLTLDGPEAERVRFSLEWPAPEEAELVWYHFRFWREDGSGCCLDQTGYHSRAACQDWQLTVYRPSHTPDWFGRGVTYQIFPDRFCRLPSDPADPAGLVGKRWVHDRWEEPPAWQPDPDGEIRNRDFFGGTLRGITARLDDLAALGVSTLYLCPIFESASNHRYNTADYTRIDPMLGTESDFRTLCREARARGIRVLLDGVFNHTGSQSRYFNADGFYPTLGAAQSQDSPYYDWYTFRTWPEDYDAWWGIRTLPAVREETPSYRRFITEAPDAILRRWLLAGASGWRLDVADELPDCFLELVRTALEETDPEAFLLGEVWEDASTKIAYGRRRKYLLGGQLHGVMNYPFRTALLAYLLGGDADHFREAMETLREHYPPDAFASAMNFLGTHDTPRILTVLGAAHRPERKADRAVFRLSPSQRALGEARVLLAALILFTFPGSPTVYYGDELGMEGWEDPFNRGTYPREPSKGPLYRRFRQLGQFRQREAVLQSGALEWRWTAGPVLVFARRLAADCLVTAVNAAPLPQHVALAWEGGPAEDLLTGARFPVSGGTLSLALPPYSGLLLR